MKKISFISLNFLVASAITVSMETTQQQQGLKKELSHQAMKMGDPNAVPYTYAAITAESLQNNKVFKKLKEQAAPLELQYEITLEEVFLLPTKQQEEFLQEAQQNPDFLQISQLITSTIANSIPQNEPLAPAIETCSATPDNQQAATTAGLSWKMWSLQKGWGDLAALEYALDNDLFNQQNIDHMSLLFSSLRNCTETHKDLNSNYVQEVRNLRAEQCYTMVALLQKLKENISTITTELENIKIEQAHTKEMILQQHHSAYENNNLTLEKLQAVCSQKNISNDAYNAPLTACPKLQKELAKLDNLNETTTAVATIMNGSVKNLIYDIESRFAIENNK